MKAYNFMLVDRSPSQILCAGVLKGGKFKDKKLPLNLPVFSMFAGIHGIV